MFAALFALFAAPLVALRAYIAAHGSAADVADKWARNLGAATTEMQAGVDRVSVAPGAAAAQKRQKWIQALQDPTVQDKWARNVASVSLPEWQAAMKNYGINRVAQGAQEKKSKMQSAMDSLLPFIDNLSARVRAMPDNTYQDREQRMLTQVRGMREYRKS